MSGFSACSTGKIKDLNSENSVQIFQIDFVSTRESLKERMRSVSHTQCHGPYRVREILQIVHEVSRGLSKALLVVIAGVEVWCSGELRLLSTAAAAALVPWSRGTWLLLSRA